MLAQSKDGGHRALGREVSPQKERERDHHWDIGGEQVEIRLELRERCHLRAHIRAARSRARACRRSVDLNRLKQGDECTEAIKGLVDDLARETGLLLASGRLQAD